jgi:S-adenosylmethionine:tRNA ribosyltransferase-isomerase
VIDRAGGTLDDHVFYDLPELLRAGDCLVINDSRVIPARVFAEDAGGRRSRAALRGAAWPDRWRALVRPGRRCHAGVELRAGGEGGAALRVATSSRTACGSSSGSTGTIEALLGAHGLPPLPPYIARHAKPVPRTRSATRRSTRSRARSPPPTAGSTSAKIS